ncbi:MAG: hypothetical protein KF833_11635 [Verrucomicrobiae bacterium]|nr:hypothetical protein [Verrucomicrobiae bacterium]
MTPDDPRWRTFPVLRELHDQWWRARGTGLGRHTRPFSRDWEQLLEAAGLLSADHRADAERDARLLAGAGLLRLTHDRRRPHLLQRVQIPLDAESRLATLFGDPLETEPSGPDPAAIDWEPELAFLRDARQNVALDDFVALNRFLATGGRLRPIVPVKERSIEVLGDEKRLDALLVTAPFRTGRITPSDLRCAPVPEPLGWRRGHRPDGPVLVLENASTWDSYCRWDAAAPRFSALVYGKGLVFIDAVTRLHDLFAEIQGPRPIEYFGDLDPPGIDIPVRASEKAVAAGLPPIQPHLWSYQRLLEAGPGREGAWDGEPVRSESLSWLGPLAPAAHDLFARGLRLAQELVGWETLATHPAPLPAPPCPPHPQHPVDRPFPPPSPS